MREIRTIGLLGTGVIGAGWAARALHCGYNVIAADTNAEMQEWLQGAIDTAQSSLDALYSDIPLPPRGKLSFTTDLMSMAQQADFIQESIPEDLAIKRKVLVSVLEEAEPDVIVSSSTSGFMPTELQEGVRYPERVLVGHPFNPVYLCPLVEIVCSPVTSAAARDSARNLFESIGMHVLMVRREVPGHISDRLQEAMWREIVHSLNDNIATTEELDDSIVYGPGLRWAVMGMNQIYMIAGGKGGARHFMQQFGPTLKLPWCHMDAPELTKEIIERFARGTEEQAKGKSIRELESIRDECLVAIQRVLAKHNIGSGRALNDFSERMQSKKQNPEIL